MWMLLSQAAHLADDSGLSSLLEGLDLVATPKFLKTEKQPPAVAR
jgi:hypothetical protein